MSKMRNTAVDLNAYLFDALDALTNTDLKGEELRDEVLRADNVANIANTIIKNNETIIKAMSLQNRMFESGSTANSLEQVMGIEMKDE